MNGPRHPLTARGGGTGYDDDLHGGAVGQAALLRAGRAEPIDRRHVAEEIREQHRRHRRRLERNPGLKASLEAIREEACRQARVAARAETGPAIDAFPDEAPGWNVIDNPPPRGEDLPSR